ncbi:MAG: DNA repair protein RecN [Fibromonadaceae bacterium]|jgi:DNA repair protein RecN (Recombination protein N)|nr:DNA repair protein RecN [Fibromonadaceae bacterium]
MLKHISIKNLALIASVEVSFANGFWAITGETGAGKSVFLNALKILCGAKTNAGQVRNGENSAVLRGIFEIKNLQDVQEFLEEKEIDFEDFELEIQREIFINGKSKARINGVMASQNDLQELGEMLMQLHGQSEQTLLKDTKSQQKLIDAYCGNEELLQKCKETYEKLSVINKKIEECKQNAEAIAQQKEFLQFQLNELKNANLRLNEEEECERIVQESAGGEFKRKMANECLELLMGESGISNLLGELVSKLQKLEAKTADAPKSEAALSAEDYFNNLVLELKKLGKEDFYSPEQIEKANARIALIQKLKRKYKTDLNSLITLREKRKQELESLENSDSDIEELQKSAAKINSELEQICAELSKKRVLGAKKLDAEVANRLHTLSMPTAAFSTHWTALGNLSANGAEQGEFWMAPNKGEGEKPLRQSASGGELSRVLLSFKHAMAERDKVPILVFDEVDSGISGEVAHKIGECLQELGKYHQVLTITHLHQVAALANGQFCVKKIEDQNRTYTIVEPLGKEERISEIARMLGDEKSPTVLAHARELLAS